MDDKSYNLIKDIMIEGHRTFIIMIHGNDQVLTNSVDNLTKMLDLLDRIDHSQISTRIISKIKNKSLIKLSTNNIESGLSVEFIRN